MGTLSMANEDERTEDSDASEEWTRIGPQVPTRPVEAFKRMLEERYGKVKGPFGNEIGTAMDLLTFAYQQGYSASEVKELIKKDMADNELMDEMKDMKFQLSAIRRELVDRRECLDSNDNDR